MTPKTSSPHLEICVPEQHDPPADTHLQRTRACTIHLYLENRHNLRRNRIGNPRATRAGHVLARADTGRAAQRIIASHATIFGITRHRMERRSNLPTAPDL